MQHILSHLIGDVVDELDIGPPRGGALGHLEHAVGLQEQRVDLFAVGGDLRVPVR